MVPFDGLAHSAPVHGFSETDSRSCAIDGIQTESPMDAAEDPAPFHSAEAALRFALSREGQPGRPLASRMTDVTGPRNFAGLDAAAQAGMILSTVRPIGSPAFDALCAEVAPPTIPCYCRMPCCSGRRPNRIWRDAIDILAHDSGEPILPRRVTHHMRQLILAKIFSEKAHHRRKEVTLLQIAEDLDADVDTISKHHRTLVRWLRGAPAGRDGAPPILGIVTKAWRDAEDALRDAGIVG